MIKHVYNHTQKLAGNGTVNFETDTFKIILVNDYTFVGGHQTYGDVSAKEILDGNGYYTAGGYTLANTTWTVTGNKTIFSADNITSDPSTQDNSDTFNGFILMDTTVDKLICYIDLEQDYVINELDFLYIPAGADGFYCMEVLP